jgi:Fe-S cluster biogenesis protein NfuA/nitrite reductase/ring-hydroxylating ferredoxin subunit
VAQIAEDLVRTIVTLYGEGLAHVVAIAGDPAQGGGSAVVHALIADPLVEGLLLVHDLHPLDVDIRIQRALDGIRPYLGSHAGGVEYLGVDADGVVRLKLEGSCHGCPSSMVTVRLAIERAIGDAAPEATRVEVEGVVPESTGPKLLQIGRRVPDRPARTAVAGVDAEGWAHLPPWPVGGADSRAVNVAGAPVLVCRVGGALYAYRDSCPECGSSLAKGEIDGAALRCPGCRRQYDLRLAGLGLDDPARHLDPLPLLSDEDGGGVRIAVGVRTNQ